MAILFENPVPIWVVGAVLVVVYGTLFLVIRSLRALLVLVGVVLVTFLLLAVERMVVTDREAVEVAITELMELLEKNDMQGVLSSIDLAATQVRSDVETLMPMVQVEDTGATLIKIEVNASVQPLVAASEFRGKVNGIHARSGARVFYFDRVLVDWTKKDGRWLVTGYTAMRAGRPLDAVGSMKSNRPVSAR